MADVAYVMSPNMVTDFRFGYNRFDQTLRNGASLDGAFGLGGFGGTLPSLNITGFSPLGTSATMPEHAVNNSFNWVWNWSWHRGMHNLKWGTDIRRIRADGFEDSLLGSVYGPNGSAFFTPGATLSTTGFTGVGNTGQFNALAAFLLGAPTQTGATNYLTTPTIRQTQYGAWLGDTVQIMRRLSLDFGVRYDVFGTLRPRDPGGAMFYNASNNTFNYAGIGGVDMNQYKTDTNNVAPRFGFAYRATDKMVVRGGYSIQYFQAPYALMGFMPAVTGTVAGTSSGFGVAPGFGTGIGGLGLPVTGASALVNGTPAGNIPATIVPRNLDTPYIQNFSLQVQREFYYGTMLNVGYVGAMDRHLLYNQELNAAFPGTGPIGMAV